MFDANVGALSLLPSTFTFRCSAMPFSGGLANFFANVGTLNLRDRDQPNSPDTDKSDSLAHSSKRERTCADTVGTVLVPWAGHFEC